MSKADSIKERLKKVAITEGKQFDYVLTLYFTERTLYRLSQSKYKDKFILKGGLLLYTILDEKARATKDIDMLAKDIQNNLDEIRKVFLEIISIESDDAIVFDTSRIELQRIKEEADYEGVRIKITAFLDKTKKVLQFDLGFGDIVIPKPIDMTYPTLLNMGTPTIKVYSIESVIAEKFEAMLSLAEVNSRMKDFYDIHSISNKFDIDGNTLGEAIRRTISRRKTKLYDSPSVFSDSFIRSKEKHDQWNAFKNRILYKSDVSFESVSTELRNFLEPVYESIRSDSTFNMKWNHKKGNWININPNFAVEKQ